MFALALYAASLDFVPNGDAVYYANIVDTVRFDQLTLHQGYYVLGWVFARAGAVFGATTLQSLTVMNAVLGAGMLALAFVWLRRRFGSTPDALVGSLLLLASHRVFLNATTAESYAMQALAVWAAFLAFESRRAVLAGGLFAIALWVSPLSGLFALWFPVFAWTRGMGPRPVVRAGSAGVILYAPFLVFFHQELFWGVRGLLNYAGFAPTRPGVAVVDFVRFQVKHFSVGNLLLLPALFGLRGRRDEVLETLAVLLPNVLLLTRLGGEDHVFVLPLDLFFVFWFVVGWRTLMRVRALRPVAVGCVVGQVLVFALTEPTLLRPAGNGYIERMREIGATVETAGERPLVFTDWSRSMALVYANREQPSYPLEEGPWYERTFDVAKLVDRTPTDFADRDAVFVVESYEPSAFARLVRGEDALAGRFEALSVRRRAERFLGTECELVSDGDFPLYRCR